MDWIERLTRFAPDGGDGSLELLSILSAALFVGAFFLRGRIAGCAQLLRSTIFCNGRKALSARQPPEAV